MAQTSTPSRICFTLQVRPEMLAEYIEKHSPVSSEMLAEIAAAGRRNYSLFVDDQGCLIGYYETDDDDAAQRYLAASPVAARWEAEMAPYFVALTGRPDQAARQLREVFHLETQSASSDQPPRR